jgi:predicted kinase
MPKDLLQKLVDEYYGSRPNLAIPNSPLCVFFFACSGSGKSTTRRRIVEAFKATYVCNDEVRDLLARYPEAIDLGIELKHIVAETVEKIYHDSPNKFVVFDNNIIQYYMHEDSYLNVAKAKGRPVFIIGLEATETELRERIIARGINVAHLINGLPQQLEDYRKATKDIAPNWSMRIDGDSNELFSQIEAFRL